MIRAPFIESPSSWLRASRSGHDKVKFAVAIEVGRRPIGFYLWRWLKEAFK